MFVFFLKKKSTEMVKLSVRGKHYRCKEWWQKTMHSWISCCVLPLSFEAAILPTFRYFMKISFSCCQARDLRGIPNMAWQKISGEQFEVFRQFWGTVRFRFWSTTFIQMNHAFLQLFLKTEFINPQMAPKTSDWIENPVKRKPKILQGNYKKLLILWSIVSISGWFADIGGVTGLPLPGGWS